MTQRQTEVHPVPQRTRPLGTTRARQTVQTLTAGRQTVRDARTYAELWHQALKTWDVRQPRPITPVLRYGPGGSFDLSTLGEHLPDLPSALITPLGEVRETEVAAIINTLQGSTVPDAVTLGGFLERYRRGLATPATLADPGGGWTYPRARSVAYALACLTLATQLGDPHPELPRWTATLRQMVRAELAQTPT